MPDSDIEYDYLIDSETDVSPILLEFKEHFDIMLGDDINRDGSFLETNLNDFIHYINSVSKPAKAVSTLQIQAYSLYVLAVCVSHTEKVEALSDEFYSDKYFPLIYSALTNHLSAFKRMLSSHESQIYKFIENKAADIVGFSLAVYNLSPNVIKADTQKIFFKTFFLETSPFNIQDPTSYYHTQLQYIYYEYIKTKTQGLVPIEDLLELKEANKISAYSRLSIYEQGVRNHRIKTMCLKSDTLKEIDRNYDRLRGRILSNKFVSLFKQSTGIELKDNKTTLIYLNSLNLTALEKAYPLVCKLLRSIRVRSDIDLFNDDEKLEIRDIIYHTTLGKLRSQLGTKVSSKLASHLAQSVTLDLVTGEYIDPRTMSRVIVNSKVFISQFQRFLLNVLESLEV